MRRRIVGVAVASAALAFLLFLVPLALALFNVFMGQEASALEREALNAALVIDPAFSAGDQAELPNPATGTDLGLYDSTGHLVTGVGPPHIDVASARTLIEYPSKNNTVTQLVSIVPVTAAEKITGAVRAAASIEAVWQKTLLGWMLSVVVALLALAVTWLVARKLARQISRPLEQLAEASARLGRGEFDVRLPPTGVKETDLVGSAMGSAAASLEDLISRERVLSANVSHQLRTPLTGLRASLEAALSDPGSDLRAAAEQALRRVDDLGATIEDVISLTRGTSPTLPQVDLGLILERAEATWRGPLAEQTRSLRVRVDPELKQTTVAPVAVSQILEILLENALKHGAGPVTLTARNAGDIVAVDVKDMGGTVANDGIFLRGVSGNGGTGVGLALARRLAEDQGGRLLLSQRTPFTQFTLLLPAVQ